MRIAILGLLLGLMAQSSSLRPGTPATFGASGGDTTVRVGFLKPGGG